MDKRYPALSTVSSLLKTISIIVIVVGVGSSVWLTIMGKQLFGAASQWSLAIGVIGILLSVVAGVLIYALGDLFRCMMDIESNTRKKGRVTATSDEAESPVPLKPKRNGSSGLPRILKVETVPPEKRPAR